ncbi:MAG: hypothetical protein O7E53_02905 [Alphaproteobacteria bacterium]|nr:hypothetical protein [Alphaproteobacteria bacterium]
MKTGLNVFFAVALALAMVSPAGNAEAQGLGLGGPSGKPIEVTANEGIEWHQKQKRYIARGKAKAIQGNTTVHGNTLIAYYDDSKEKGSEIYRIDAIGDVKIVSPTETAYGDKGVYDVRNGVLVLTGRNLKLVTKNEIVTARDSLEYYEKKSMAVARGNAKMRLRNPAKGGERTIRADVLTTRFNPPGTKAGKGKSKGKRKTKSGGEQKRMERMDAFGNVVITRPGEIALGERGVYLPNKEIAELWGNVRITRGKNQLNGERAIVNFKTGISRLIAGKPGKGSPPVRVLLYPDKSKKNSTKPSKSRQ